MLRLGRVAVACGAELELPDDLFLEVAHDQLGLGLVSHAINDSTPGLCGEASPLTVDGRWQEDLKAAPTALAVPPIRGKTAPRGFVRLSNRIRARRNAPGPGKNPRGAVSRARRAARNPFALALRTSVATGNGFAVAGIDGNGVQKHLEGLLQCFPGRESTIPLRESRIPLGACRFPVCT